MLMNNICDVGHWIREKMRKLVVFEEDACPYLVPDLFVDHHWNYLNLDRALWQWLFQWAFHLSDPLLLHCHLHSIRDKFDACSIERVLHSDRDPDNDDLHHLQHLVREINWIWHDYRRMDHLEQEINFCLSPKSNLRLNFLSLVMFGLFVPVGVFPPLGDAIWMRRKRQSENENDQKAMQRDSVNQEKKNGEDEERRNQWLYMHLYIQSRLFNLQVMLMMKYA